MEISDCHFMQIEYVASQLESHIEKGLTQVEAERRFKEHGPNELAEKPRPGFLKMLLDQFNNFLVIILIIAAVVSLLLGEVIDAVAIMVIVVLNAALGVVQEYKAEAALAAQVWAGGLLQLPRESSISDHGSRSSMGSLMAGGGRGCW